MKYFAGLLVAGILLGCFMFMGTVSAQFDPLEQTCVSTNENSTNNDAQPICDASSDPVDPISGEESLIIVAANILAFLAGVIAVIVVIVAGITMMTSNGDAGKITSSRNAIIYTVIGLIIIVVARTIVLFIVSRVAT